MVSLFSAVVGQYPNNFRTMVVRQGSGSVFKEVVRKDSGNIFIVVSS